MSWKVELIKLAQTNEASSNEEDDDNDDNDELNTPSIQSWLSNSKVSMLPYQRP